MQRVATEQHAQLARHPGVRLRSRVLRSSWRWTHVRVVPFLAGLLRGIPRVARQEGTEVVLFSSTVTAMLAPALRRRLPPGVRLAAIAHGLDVTTPNTFWQRQIRRTFGALDAVLPVSRATAEECARRGMPPERIHVVHNGVDTSRFPPVAGRAAARRELWAALAREGAALPEGALVLCGVGRHVRRKGFAWFAREVIPRLPAEVVWVLAGEGPETPAVRAAVREQGLEKRVILPGRVSEERLALLLRGADLFVMPNVPVPGDMEGFGVVMLEAGLSGLPVVGARLEGIRDAIAEGENGTLVPTGDAPAFAEAILRFHADRPALEQASARAREYVERTFGWPETADRYVRLLSSLPRRG